MCVSQATSLYISFYSGINNLVEQRYTRIHIEQKYRTNYLTSELQKFDLVIILTQHIYAAENQISNLPQ